MIFNRLIKSKLFNHQIQILKYFKMNNQEMIDEKSSTDLVNEVEIKPRHTARDCSGIDKLDENTFNLAMSVRDYYFSFLYGRHGKNKLKLEADTQTRIQIPARGQGELVIIEGSNEMNVAKCRHRIEALICNARSVKNFRHFISFPFIFDEFKEKFVQFKTKVLEQCSDDRGVDGTIFQLPTKLHLTVCPLVLLNQDEINQASSLLEEWQKSFDQNLLNNKSLRVNIRGLGCMNEDLTHADVIYAKILQEESNPNEAVNEQPIIQLIADDLVKKCCEAGLSKRQHDCVKLHVTVMNSLKRRYENLTRKEAMKKRRESFDATNVLRLFGDYDFGWYVVDEIQLSMKFSVGMNGYYECVSKAKLL